MKQIFLLATFFASFTLWSQTKVGGMVVDQDGNPISFANVMFKNSFEGVITNEDGRFYLESEETYTVLQVSLLGYTTKEIPLEKKVTYGMKIELTEGEELDEVVIFAGKQPKKGNPAIDILKKIWEKKRHNGIRLYDQYAFDKYEKVEFDLNTIDSAMINSKLFRGMEFIFDQIDTSSVTGKTYLPVFINESFHRVYGDNKMDLHKEILEGNKNSGFSTNQTIINFIKDLYNDYNVYNNYIKLFDKSFVSPLSRTGVDVYNYVLADSTFIDDKWCYNIIYYPRRSSELTFKGDFWVNDTTFAIKDINMQLTKSANVNWVKDIYIEQEFEVKNDSVFLLKRDYIMSDFSLTKKDESKGIYGKRTTVYDNYEFDKEKPKSFYNIKVDPYNQVVYNRDSSFWDTNRLEQLNKDEKGIYAMLDTLKTVPKFKRLYDLGSILSSGYIEFDRLNMDYGPIYSGFGFNDVEGVRLRGGGRTYFTQNDPWRLEGYMAYGFRDNRFKYGISGKILLDRKNRFIFAAGNRRDIEQLGVSLTATTDVLGRSFASSSIFTAGSNNTLTNINLTTASFEYEFVKNLRLKWGASFRTMRSALPEEFNLDYVDPESPTGVSSETKQFEFELNLFYTPGRETYGYGVERYDVNDQYPRFIMRYSTGYRGFLESDFNYRKLQFYYRQPLLLGGLGRSTVTLETGKIFGAVPLSLLSPIPGNQTYFTIFNTYPNLNFYEFVTDTYVSAQLEHNFNGRFFGRIPLLRKLNLREIVGIRGVWGQISDENIALSAPAGVVLRAPEDHIYYEYSVGVGNILKLFRIDFNFRGNYLDLPDVRPFSVTGAFEFAF
ncbi:DUF5686 family protein [Robertkochia solimangrovi]|uniref:DUF5686 family protein n=1 Tax=Robertkochia solimangrovi TaxID=2213046 RepID=UPI00118088AD|nr:DUF5686 family protein [Robertkochia solimangrovi]TRZ44505.1 carboxypeptidase-like regulatory domain-containing protein [Robertkochia solimangrovi]